ncbi:TonB-linked SusC/RagA family outer membrane protein [Mucilaginibacter gracilis]|uniref:TonB-dependent receptor plug n=3 Tax=Sphingobacteriaceae TaxID=84566 RepID=H1YH01_9SPHI|nr:TonB-dependent receptor plug [Mucilaginibacter paludis DSM 18603]RKR80975.1 TonB-linked SusC/RagA family outer membrane protein [Mucilaginibacter gracilis]
MNFCPEKLGRPPACALKLLRVMKLIILILTAAIIQVSAASYAQRVTLNLEKAPLAQVFKEIRKQTGIDFFYTDDLLSQSKPVSVHIKDAELKDALARCLNKQALSFTIENNIIVIHSRQPQDLPAEKAPPRIVTGKVVDEQNMFLPGVTIKVKGNPRYTVITNEKGEFVITVPDDNAILQVSYIGFTSIELPVSAMKKSAVISMKPDINNLDQVQVIAYGTTTKRLNTGDVTTITGAEIEKNPVSNVLEAMQGKVPGLFIQQATGQPGGAFSLRLRDAANFSSANGAPAPLVVVDGVTYPGAKLPMENNTLYGTGNFIQGGNGLNFLNPNDIESISVLKDADATSLYGASGAYGVVLITTKKAKPGPATLTVNIYNGVSLLGQTVQPMNTDQYLMLRREALKNDGTPVGASDKDLNGTFPTNRNVDFKKELLGGLAQTGNLNLTYGGGTLNSSYLVGGSLRNNGNIQRHKGSNIDGSLRFSINTNSADNKFSYNIAGTYLSNVNTMVPYDFSRLMSLTPPNAPDPFLPDGSVNWDSNIVNFTGDFNRTYRAVTNNLLANTSLIYRPVKGLSLRANVGYNNISGEELMGYPTTTMPPSTANAAASTHSIFHHYQVRNITIEPYAEYASTFFNKGDFSFKLGGKIDNNLNTVDEISGTGFASDALLSNPSAGTNITTTYGRTPYRDLGAYAIMKLVWNQKYIVNLNGRRDGSTRFGPNKKFGNFGSVAAAWIFSEEDLIKNNLRFLSYGKIRASTGILGGDAINDFAYLSKYTASSGTYAGKTILNPSGLANPELSWEHNKNKEIGIELGFLKDRIYVEGNYYRNIASNQLINIPLSAVTGVGSYPVNTDAVIRTSGWEMSLSTNNIRTKSLSWTTRFNMSIPTSKLLKLPTYYSLGPNYIIDKPVTGTLLYNFAGVNPQTGNPSYTNAKGITADDPSLGSADKTEFRDLSPKYYGGFQNTVTYKQLSLDFSFTFTSRLSLNAVAQNGFPVGYNGVNGGTVWLNRWQNPGDITTVPKVSATITNLLNFSQVYTNSTAAYSNATYARLQNASLRYNFAGNMLSKMHVKALSVYAQGQNLLTISNLGGLDPENLSITVIPPMRVITAGLNVSF